MAEFAAGATFADHIIRGVAGRGGMGVVYRALHVPLKREVALKVIAPEASADEAFRARFRRELEAAAAIQHPNVIPIHHAGEEDGLLYVTMRLVDGADLARVVAAQTRLEPVRAARLIAQVGAALDAAHASGVVHRDVKPANVMLEGEGESERALLTDFGLTKLLYSDTKVTQTGVVIGTFDYTAPEQLDERDVDARTDVYALGCVLFQTLTGRVPFPRDGLAAKLFAHFEAPPPSVTALVPEAPASLDAVIGQAMAKDPDDRYQSAGDLARAALAAVDRPSLARGVSRLVAGESAPGWRWDKTPAPRRRGVPLPAALTGELGAGPFVGRGALLERLRERYALAADGRAPGRRARRRARDRQVAAGDRVRPRDARRRRDGALRPLRPRVARPLPALRHARCSTRWRTARTSRCRPSWSRSCRSWRASSRRCGGTCPRCATRSRRTRRRAATACSRPSRACSPSSRASARPC